jgi:hypothetical protein
VEWNLDLEMFVLLAQTTENLCMEEEVEKEVQKQVHLSYHQALKNQLVRLCTSRKIERND